MESLFRHKMLRMLLARGKINEDLIRMMAGWRHSGFNVYAGPRIHNVGANSLFTHNGSLSRTAPTESNFLSSKVRNAGHEPLQ